MKKLFGTDGIRGIAGKSPLTNREVFCIGLASGLELMRKVTARPCRVVAVQDTRFSSSSIMDKLTQGLRAAGVDVYQLGVSNTPSVAYLVQAHHFHTGVVVSASHNPPQFNGIKFFNSHGRKWPDEWERDVEKKCFSSVFKKKVDRAYIKKIRPGRLISAASFIHDYELFLHEAVGINTRFSQCKLAVDCSNGANFQIAPDIFRRLGARCYFLGIQPNGRNINVNCGSQKTERLSKLVRSKKCDMGIAFDGDGDRVIFTDERGREVDGDFTIALLAKSLLTDQKLRNRKAVITVMANLGLKKALHKLGIRTVETAVGDRYVSEAMRKHRLALGGEQSGHIILGDYLPTGDGLLTALYVVKAFQKKNTSFSKMVSWMKKYPQVLINVPVRHKKPLPQMDGVQGKINEVKSLLGKNGRVLVRYSGTEPLLRIMLEGPNRNKLHTYANGIAEKVKAAAS